MKKISLVIFFTICAYLTYGQDTAPTKPYKQDHIVDLSIGLGQREITSALSWNHLHGFGKKNQRFMLGYGIRYTFYAGSNKYYTTAPAKYTSPVQGPTTIFSETIEENIDTVAISNPVVNSLNLSFHLQYKLYKKLELGCNIDVVGFSFGSTKKGSIISSVLDSGESPVCTARPTTFNLLLTSDNDFGSLNSEFYLRYWISPKVGLRAGYTFYFSEYTTDREISFDNSRIENDRYRLKSGLIMLALSWKPFKH